MKHALKKSNTWYAALTIPQDVRHVFGKVRFFQSTKTGSAAQAAPRVALLVSRWQAEIAKARGSVPNPKDTFWSDLRKQYAETSDEGTQIAIEEIAKAAAGRADDPRLYRVAIGVDPVPPEPTPLGPLVADWKGSLGKLEQKTIDQRHRDVSRMTDHFVNLEALKPQAIKAWTDGLISGGGATAATIDRLGKGCRSFWAYLRQSGTVAMIEPDPFEGPFTLALKTAPRTTVNRTAFTAEELAGVYRRAASHAGGVEGDPELAHVIALGAYTGARLEELFGLKKEHCHDGMFVIVDAKTQAGIREVPVHPMVAPLVAHLVETSVDGFLLPSTAAGKYGVRSDPASKRFGRLKKAMGFGPRHVFHSIRKTVATQLEQAGVPEGVAADILGHEKQTMSYGLYSSGSSMAQKLEAISKVAFPAPLDSPLVGL